MKKDGEREMVIYEKIKRGRNKKIIVRNEEEKKGGGGLFGQGDTQIEEREMQRWSWSERGMKIEA